MEEPKPTVEGKKKHFAINIDPRGDLTLDVGPPGAKRSLRVSSSALSLGSPVFSAMLNSTFKEGTLPADGSLRSIPLPYDNPRAVTTLCNVLHHQSQYVRVEKFDDIDQLAILCDKYYCARALRPWTTLWLQKWYGSESGEDEYWKMLYISYAFDNRSAVYTASLGILRHYTEDNMTDAPATRPGLAILPDGVINGLQTRRRAIVERIYQQLENIAVSCMGDACSKISIHVSREVSCFSTAKIGSYFLELARLDLWPLSETLRKCSIEEVFCKLSSFEDYTIEVPKRRFMICDCDTCAADFKGDLQGVVVEVSSSLMGLCLTCVGSGRASVATGNCERISSCGAAGNDGIGTRPPPVACELAVPAERW